MKKINLIIGFLLLSLVSMAQYSGSAPVMLSGVPAGATNIQWYKDGVAISSATNATYNAPTPGQYYASFTDVNTACTADRTITFILVQSSGSTTLSADSTNSGGSAYQWYNNTTAVSGANSQSYTATTGGLYSLKYNIGNCTVQTPQYYVFVIDPNCTINSLTPVISKN